MKKVCCVFDSFKGTLSSIEVNRIAKEAIESVDSQIKVITVPIADGGEGTVDVFLEIFGNQKIYVTVSDPYFQPVHAYYGISDHQEAIIEMASCAGLPLVGENKNPELTTTFGVGEIIKDALNRNCKKVIIGLGGSATHDCGCGAAAALGVRFYDRNQNSFVPTGATLHHIESVDLSRLDKRLQEVEIVALCDVKNTLYGPFGAAKVFSPQKGADKAMINRLEEGSVHFANILSKEYQMDIQQVIGSGAAGGMGAGIVAFLNGSLQSGIDVILELVRFDQLIMDVDLILTGEGKIDQSSFDGKVIDGIAKRAKEANKTLVAIAGSIDIGEEVLYEKGYYSVYCTNTPLNQLYPLSQRVVDDLYQLSKVVITDLSREL